MTTIKQEIRQHAIAQSNFMDLHNRNDVDGYYRIPNLDKYVDHMYENLIGKRGGNCFYSNFELYKKMYSFNKNVKLYMVKIKNSQNPRGITHMLVVDGDIFYDNSQFRQIKQNLVEYMGTNIVTSHTHIRHDPKFYSMNKDEWTLCLQVIEELRIWTKGSIPITKSSFRLAVDNLFK